MWFVPLILILLIAAMAYPSAVPALLAYFIVGGLMGAFFNWVCHRHPDETMRRWAQPVALWNLYAWPLAIIGMFIFKGKAAK